MFDMSMVKIIIPTSDYEKTWHYYSQVLGFTHVDGFLKLPESSSDVVLKLMIVDRESSEKFPPRRGFPLFNFEIADEFLSYCNDLFLRGALIQEVLETPGGYYALISDLDGNQFEVECSNFGEHDNRFDKSSWSFYRRL